MTATAHIPNPPQPERERLFDEILREYGDTINGICYSFAGRVNEFDDLRQDALVNIWRGLDTFANRSDLRTWIYRVTLNSCVSVYRRGAVARGSVPLDNAPEQGEDAAADRDNIQWARSLLAGLGAEDRAMMLMWLDDLPYDEIAAVMGMNRNTVASRLRRAKEKMRRAGDGM